MPATESSLIYPSSVTRFTASAQNPVRLSVGQDTLRYGTSASSLSGSITAGQSETFTSARYIQTDGDGAVLFERFGEAETGTVYGIELGYAEITDAFGQTGVGSSDVTGLSVAVTVGERPIKIIFDSYGVANSAGTGVTTVGILEGETTLALGLISLTTAAISVHREVRLNPSPGAHTYKINLAQSVTGNSSITAAATSPTFIQVIEV